VMERERIESTCAICGEVIWYTFSLWHHTITRPADVPDHLAVPIETGTAESKE
jgi:hypothetical protein